MNVLFSKSALKDYQFQAGVKGAFKKINSFIKDIQRGNMGPDALGHPEQLKGDLSGFSSRKIDKKHRFVYRIIQSNNRDVLFITSCLGHYE